MDRQVRLKVKRITSNDVFAHLVILEAMCENLTKTMHQIEERLVGIQVRLDVAFGKSEPPKEESPRVI